MKNYHVSAFLERCFWLEAFIFLNYILLLCVVLLNVLGTFDFFFFTSVLIAVSFPLDWYNYKELHIMFSFLIIILLFSDCMWILKTCLLTLQCASKCNRVGLLLVKNGMCLEKCITVILYWILILSFKSNSVK